MNHQRTGTRHGEQEFTTTLRPYFYPDAQRARTERFVLAEFVPLSGISPIRQQLGSDVLSQLNIISWQKAAGTLFPAAQVSQNSAPQTVNDEAAVVIPDMLGLELQSIANDVQDFDIQQKGGVFLVRITLNNGGTLALALQKSPEMRIIQVNLIDSSRDINENISSKLHEERRVRFSINQGNRGIFRKLVQEALFIYREMVRIAEEKHREAVEEELRRAKQRQDEQDALARSRVPIVQQRDDELIEAQRQLQEQRVLAQSLDEQWRAAQRDLENLRIESQAQLDKREIEITQLAAQLDAAKQHLAAQEANEKAIEALMVASHQRSEEQQQLAVLRSNVEALDKRLMEAQKELAKQQQLEVQLNEGQEQIETQKQNAQVLERRLSDFQVKLAAREKLETQLNKTQQQLEAQQLEVSELQTELNATRSQLQALKERSERRRLHLLPFRGKNRDGPVNATGKEKDALLTIIIAVVLLIIIAAVLVFIFGRMRLLAW